MRILYLAQRVPYPPNRGDKITTYHTIRHLARRHEVAVACLADGEEDLSNLAGLQPLTSSIDAVLLSPVKARLRALGALAAGEPFTRGYFGEPELRARVRARLATGRFDAVIPYGSGVAQFIEDADDVARIMWFADLDSQKWALYARDVRRPAGWLYHLESRRLLDYERRLARAFDHSVVCTPRERHDFKRLIPGSPVTSIGNGVDVDHFRPIQGAEKEALSLVLTGVMDYRPNVEGALWFCRHVLPLVRERAPDVSLTICGARPVRAVRLLGRLPGVTVTGAVPDVRPYLARSAVAVVPLHTARGIQNKLLEAMAMGLPVVATTAAFAGVEARRDTELLVADESREFADQVLRLLRDADLRAQIGRAARARIERDYRWDAQLTRLDALLRSIGQGRALGDLRVAGSRR